MESQIWVNIGSGNGLLPGNTKPLPETMLVYHPWDPLVFNTLRPRQNGRHFPDDIYKCIFLNENVWISIKISLIFVPMGPINNIPAMVEIMAWRRSGDKPLSAPMLVRLLTHICVTRPQWVNWGQFHRNCSRYHSIQNVWKLHIWKYRYISQAPMS